MFQIYKPTKLDYRTHLQIVTSQQIKSNSGSMLVTFDAMATSEMTPSAKGMIWMADRDGRVISAETTLVVGSQDKQAVSLQGYTSDCSLGLS